MKSFLTYINEARGFISGSGAQSERHAKKYIDPHIGSGKFTHILGKEHNGLESGSKLTLHKKENIDGKIHVHASDENGQKHLIPVSKLHKPGEESPNKGHKFESDFIDKLKHHGLMDKNASGAGSTSGTDFTLINKKKHTEHPGIVHHHEGLLNGETKQGITAAMGQLTIHHTKEKGWHIGDKAREKRPQYAEEIEKSGILEHMNKHHDPDKHGVESTSSGRAKTITMKHPDLEPGKAYLKDHHVHVLHVGGGYGTYSVGKKDPTGHGLPEISGKGMWHIREKQLGNKRARTVAFHPDGKNGLTKSHVNLDNEEHIKAMKKTLGHDN